ncbi:hypothetical protein [Marinomonas transparens]|uniref:Uncharacterized protein n=1 Tax=Marinomonas transparens TaxID=2795388 RepID=A0A934N0N7_9GAMM|nr:hypothetical protein [Marinomonas transparens]MBJ7536902.1 hypothetical protein [Marinomonas transparens]
MENKTLFKHFTETMNVFFVGLNHFLSNRSSAHLLHVSPAQNLACYQVDDTGRCMHLRLVFIPQSKGMMLGRLSWLDKRGQDHVCCYVDERLNCLERQADGHWGGNNKQAYQACLNCLESLVA